MHKQKMIILVNLVILLTHIDGKQACLEEERKGLLELKSFMKIQVENGSDHLLSSWVDDPTSDCCGWERVTCNSTTGRIAELDLFNIAESEMELNSLQCYSDADSSSDLNITFFQSFKEIKALNLSCNGIKWRENQGFLRLQQLETLDLSYNRLTSSHLHSLRMLKSLKNLILARNFFYGSFPARELSVFENLETLDLSWNTLQDSPAKLDSGNFSKLRDVMLHDNLFYGTDIMRFMGSLPSLKSLDLSFNYMGGTLLNQDLVAFGRLEVLDISNNYFDEGIPQNIGKLSSLKALYLAENKFNGSLPVPGLCELRRLEVLDIHGNSFEGTLPPCLSNLTSLKILDLHDNLFIGPFTPNSIRRQKFLRFIDISSNYFEGSFSINMIFNHSMLEVLILESKENKVQIDNDDGAGIPLFQLKALRLSNCNLKSAQFLLNQHRLTWVDISHNKLSGAFPSWLLQNNTGLRFLNLRNNSFSGKLELPPSRSIGHLEVSYNHIEGHLPQDLGLILPNLHCLNLSYNSIEGELPSSIGAMRKLLLLDLSFNELSGEVPMELTKNCTELLGLMLNNNNFHGEFFSTQFNLSNIRLLRLGNNRFTGNLLTKKEFYSRMKIFDVSNNNMTGTIPNELSAKIVLLQNNSFEGQIPCEGFLGAEVIDISHNFLSGPIPSCLSPEDLSHVLVLNLRGNRLSGNIPAQISLLPRLRILLLGDNRFNGSIPRQLCRLRTISIMALSNNSFSGSIPSCLSNISFGNDSHDSFEDLTVSYWLGSVTAHFGSANPLQELYDSTGLWDIVVLGDKYMYTIDFVTKNILLSYKGNILNYMSGLDLSCNNLTGDIPQSLGELTSLHALNLSHNQLMGLIPVSLLNLYEVESLDFSYNKLSGTIPSELVDLNFLAVFSIAHNNFSGRVPDKGQFATFGTNSYEGNPFLSGLPSEKNRSEVVEMPFPSDEAEEKGYKFHLASFFASFFATYCAVLLTSGAILYIKPHWRMRWFCFIDDLVYKYNYF